MQAHQENWNKKFEELIIEVMDSVAVYKNLAAQEAYPNHQSFFKRRYEKQQDNAEQLLQNYGLLYKNDALATSATRARAFKSLKWRTEKEIVGPAEIDKLILEGEENLIESYQRVLSHPNTPPTICSLLQSQAEVQNNMLLELRT